MIQGKGKIYFHEKTMKSYIEKIMEKIMTEILFTNKTLKNLPENPKSKRKMPTKTVPYNICGRTFVNEMGVSNHKKRMHGVKHNESIQKSDSI